MDQRYVWVSKKNNVCYVDESFFENWSPKMAYILGFFAADGCLTINRKRGNKYIEFVSTDEDIIEKIKYCLKSKHKIGLKAEKSNWKRAYRLQIGSKKMFNDLIDKGFMPNKSKVLKFPAIPTNYLSHFIRGYFDGDGHCAFYQTKRKNRSSLRKVVTSGFTSGSSNFLKTLKGLLEKHTLIKGGTLHFHDGYRLVYSTKNSKELYQFMYKEIADSVYLERKYITFQNAFKQFGLVV